MNSGPLVLHCAQIGGNWMHCVVGSPPVNCHQQCTQWKFPSDIPFLGSIIKQQMSSTPHVLHIDIVLKCKCSNRINVVLTLNHITWGKLFQHTKKHRPQSCQNLSYPLKIPKGWWSNHWQFCSPRGQSPSSVNKLPICTSWCSCDSLLCALSCSSLASLSLFLSFLLSLSHKATSVPLFFQQANNMCIMMCQLTAVRKRVEWV